MSACAAALRCGVDGGFMKTTASMLTAACVLAGSLAYAHLAYAQSQIPSGRGSTTGDPAASSANPAASPTTTGRDTMPETANRPTIPLDKQNKPAVGH
jgi:hypothetical protein